MEIENQICQAIEIIVDKAVHQAGYDRTIQGVIQQCVDATIGKYKIKHQDSIFYAYATNSDTTYANGTLVYILIPENDMDKEKTILGTVEKLGTNYINALSEEERYNINGVNCLNILDEYELSSYNDNNLIIYNKENEKDNNKIIIDNLNEYICHSSAVMCKAFFKTNLSFEHQKQGNYGIIFELNFKNNSTGDIVQRQYVLDIDNMTGNPYQVEAGQEQVAFFKIDGVNFDSINKIILFTKDFINKDIENKDIKDIFIKNIQLLGADLIDEETLSGCGLILRTPRGSFFSKTGLEQQLDISAEVRVKGKSVNPLVQKMEFYWFKSDLSITSDNAFYSNYGGRGWKCLNHYNIIEQTENKDIKKVEWIPEKDTFTIFRKDLQTFENHFKCVVVYNKSTYSKEIVIKNYNYNYNIMITSNQDTTFYFDSGKPSLTCQVLDADGKEIEASKTKNFIYSWAVENKYKQITPLINTKENQNKINTYLKLNDSLIYLNELLKEGILLKSSQITEEMKTDLQHPIYFPEEIDPSQWKTVESYIQNAEKIISNLNKTQLINGNQLLNIDIAKITDFAIYRCSIQFKDENNTILSIGEGKITLTNALKIEDTYSLVINNGNKAYQYDEFGISPLCQEDAAIEAIPALSFTLFDNLGNPISEDRIDKKDITWTIPIESSLLVNIESIDKDDNIDNSKLSEKEENIHARGLTYSIAKKYIYSYNNNTISLKVKYKGMELVAKTSFIFSKQGESGTNGSKYFCKIVPNSDKENLKPAVIFDIDEEDNTAFFNFNSSLTLSDQEESEKAPFKVLLFKSDEQVFEGTESIENISISWSVLANKYTATEKDLSLYQINKDTGKMKIVNRYNPSISYANIIQCCVSYKDADLNQNLKLYATIPLVTINKKKDYTVNLKSGSGFQSVLYSSSGIHPKYDNTQPFDVDVYLNQDLISTIENNQSSYYVQTEWNILGSIYNFNEKQIINYTDLRVEEKENQTHTAYNVKPVSRYDGSCVTNALQCAVYNNKKEIIAYIHIPIYFFLNKYGFAHLNDWNGNSIQINKEGGYILSPQIGAGQKEEDNSFTGVLMGKVQEPDRTSADIGLLGYNKGIRTFKIDAQNGAAILGANKGRIVIDPSAEKALLYSTSYYRKYKDNGLPASYIKNNCNKEGMQIDLTTPEIRFGNGNFIVDKDGHLTAKGGGSIGGWKIKNYTLVSSNDATGFASIASLSDRGVVCKDVKIPTGTETKAIAIWAGGLNSDNFYVTHDGYLKCNNATIGSGVSKIFIGKSASTDDSAIFTYNKIALDNKNKGFYIGVDGISLGRYFKVTDEGEIYALQGKIGAWTLNENQLFYSGAGIGSDTNNYSVGMSNDYNWAFWAGRTDDGEAAFRVNRHGDVKCSRMHISGGSINISDKNGTSTFSVSENGQLVATGAKITGSVNVGNGGSLGGWDVGINQIRGGRIILDSSGGIKHSDGRWAIRTDGSAYFGDVKIDGGFIGGWTIQNDFLSAADGAWKVELEPRGVYIVNTETQQAYLSPWSGICKAGFEALNGKEPPLHQT